MDLCDSFDDFLNCFGELFGLKRSEDCNRSVEDVVMDIQLLAGINDNIKDQYHHILETTMDEIREHFRDYGDIIIVRHMVFDDEELLEPYEWERDDEYKEYSHLDFEIRSLFININIKAGTIIPPIDAKTGKEAFLKDDRFPYNISFLISKPATKKNIDIKNSFINICIENSFIINIIGNI